MERQKPNYDHEGAKEALTRLPSVTLCLKLLELRQSLAADAGNDRVTHVRHELCKNVLARSLVLDLTTDDQDIHGSLVRLSLVDVKGSVSLNVTKRNGIGETGV